MIELLGGAIQAGVSYAGLPYFTERRIRRRVEDATAEVVEPLLTFLSHERISEDKQFRLFQTCVEELRPLTEKPELLFQGSLNGQKIFENLYDDREFPQVILEDGLKDIYALLGPRITTLLCRIPAAVKDWESEAWTENFSRLDEVANQLSALFSKVDELTTRTPKETDEVLTRVRRTLAQKIGFDLDITGLRADQPQAGKFDDYFVHPEIVQVDDTSDGNLIQIRIGTSDDSFNQFLLDYHRAVLIGAPGAGKSTWSKWLQREALSTRWNGIAVRIELRGLSGEPLPSLHDLIRRTAGQHFAEEITADRIRQWLDAKLLVFILDGFDEIRPNERDNVYEWVVQLSTAADGCPIVLTSRPLKTDHLDRLIHSWQHWAVEPFDEPRIIDYISRWYRHTRLLEGNREVDAVALAQSWGTDPTIGHLTGNPLLLSTLLMVHHLDGSLPSGRSQLYKRYVEGMLGLWDDRRRVEATAVHLSLEQKRQVLRGFALHLFFREEEQIDETEALAWLQALLHKMNISSQAEDVLAVLRERSGLIIGPGIYSFAHKSIGEYMVAEAIFQGDQQDNSNQRIDRLRLFTHRYEDRWNIVTFLWAGLAPVADVELFIDECIKAGALELAGGILLDQYERITSDIRRRLMLKLISVEDKPVSWDKNSHWLVSSPANFELPTISIPNFPLRSLTRGTSVSHLYIRAIDDKTIHWADSLHTRQENRDLLWMLFVYRAESITAWKSYLTATHPTDGPSTVWLFWAVETALYKALNNSFAADVQSIITAFKESCPHVSSLVPIVLMCTGLKISSTPESTETGLSSEKFALLLDVFANSFDNEVLPDWLLGTHDWLLGYVGKGRWHVAIGDLLAAFIERMEKLAERGVIERDATFFHAIKIVQELRQRRESLSPREEFAGAIESPPLIGESDIKPSG